MILFINVNKPYYIYFYIQTPVHILYNTFKCELPQLWVEVEAGST